MKGGGLTHDLLLVAARQLPLKVHRDHMLAKPLLYCQFVSVFQGLHAMRSTTEPQTYWAYIYVYKFYHLDLVCMSSHILCVTTIVTKADRLR